jgi:hypothetical protein
LLSAYLRLEAKSLELRVKVLWHDGKKIKVKNCRKYELLSNERKDWNSDIRVLMKRKLQRAYGGCLGSQRRRRARQAAKICGDWQIRIDPQVPEWDNPPRAIVVPRFIGGLTRGTETSKYPEEEKTIVIPGVVASETGRA